MVCPLVGRIFRVWTLPERMVQIPGQHDWRLGARYGKDAAGSLARTATGVQATPPAAWEASVRKFMEFLCAKGQVGYPPTISAVAKLGYSVMAYQSSDNLFDSCDGDGSM